MISDILCECVNELDYYLSCPTFDDVYRDRIIRLRNEVEYLRGLLDVPPGVQLPSEAVLLDRIDTQRTWRVEDRCYVLPSADTVVRPACARFAQSEPLHRYTSWSWNSTSLHSARPVAV
jgi:hypothetical protein